MAGHSMNIVLFRSGLKCIRGSQVLTSRIPNLKSLNFYYDYKKISSHVVLRKQSFLLLQPSRLRPDALCLPPLLRCLSRRNFSSKDPTGKPPTSKMNIPNQEGEKVKKVEDDFSKFVGDSFEHMTIGFETKPFPEDASKASGDLLKGGARVYNENTLVPDFRAIKEFLLTYNDLHRLPSMTRRSPYFGKPYITVYRRRDLEKRAIEKWGSLRNLEVQKKYMKARIAQEKGDFAAADFSSKNDKSIPYEDFNFYQTREDPSDKKNPFGVVSFAIGFNALNCFLKMGAWLYTGSHSMFAEFIHSVADTANQIILYIGIRKSMKEPDLAHPYGFAKIRNITSLMSGLGIFFLGAGLNIYHGFIGLLSAGESSSLYWALAVLGTSFVTEGATLLMALKKLMENSKLANMTLYDYISRAIDPTTNVVLLEDAAAVLGTLIAGTCISVAHFTPYSFADPLGSLLIGTLLGGVASIIISTNAGVLVGRSIPADKRQVLVSELEAHKMIRSTIDVKATEVGGKSVKFKAEVDFDGREITKHYLSEMKANDEDLLKEMQAMRTPEEAREFMLRHGEGIVDMVGAVIDDIERDFKGRHPEIKYCDLEQL